MAKTQKRFLGPGNNHQANTFTVDGITDTLSGWSKRLGCSYMALYKRLLRGMSPEEAIRAGGDHLWRTYLTIGGERHTIAEWARKTGVDADTISERISQLGWPIEEAVGLKPHPNRTEKNLTYRGKTRNISQWAKELGLTDVAMRARLRLFREGRMARSAVFAKGNLSPWRKVRKTKYQNWYKGKRITIDEICRLKGCGRTLVNSWFKAGFTATQILESEVIKPCRDQEELHRRQAAAQRRNRHIRELKKIGLLL